MASSSKTKATKALPDTKDDGDVKAKAIKAHSDTKDDGDIDSCGDCGKVVSRGQKALQCDVCHFWHHIGCEKVCQDVYQFLCEHNEEAGLRWLCRKCQTTYQTVMNSICRLEKAHQHLEDKVACMGEKFDALMKGLDDSKIGQFDSKIDQIQQKIQESTEKFFTEKVTHMDEKFEKVLNDLGSCNNSSLQHRFQDDLEEVEEVRRRKTNVIIHGLKEPADGDKDSEHEQDASSIEHLLHELKCDEVSVNSTVRLGKKPAGEDTKPRPIKLVLASEEHKDKVLRGAKNLKYARVNTLDKVFIHQDLTPRQREQRKKLVEELKVRRSQGEQNLIIVKDRILVKRYRGVATQESE